MSRCDIRSFRISLTYQCDTSTLQWRQNGRDGVSNHQPIDCSLNSLFKAQIKKNINASCTGLCEGNSPLTDEFPVQGASNPENVSIWWRHHESADAIIWAYTHEISKPYVFLFKVTIYTRFIQGDLITRRPFNYTDGFIARIVSTIHLKKVSEESIPLYHHSDVLMSAMASQITGVSTVYSTIVSGESKHQSSASLAFVRGIPWWPVNSLHKSPVTRKVFPFDGVIERCTVVSVLKHVVSIMTNIHSG